MIKSPQAVAPPDAGERVAKVIARSGLCSRREAETLIAQGRVEIDGETLSGPAINLRPGQRLTVDGELLPALEPVRLFRYHKPRGVLVAACDLRGRPTIYDRLPLGLPRLMPVGRLDYNSEGLLLLTNDGSMKRRLELPATGWRRRYRVRVHGRPQTEALEGLAGGVVIEEVAYGPIEAKLDEQRGANAWLTFSLREGKNREIRKVCEHLGLAVNRLIRLAYGPFQLGGLARDEVEEVPAKVIGEQLGDGSGPKRRKPESARPKKAAPRAAESQIAEPKTPQRAGGKAGRGAKDKALVKRTGPKPTPSKATSAKAIPAKQTPAKPTSPKPARARQGPQPGPRNRPERRGPDRGKTAGSGRHANRRG